MTTRMTCTSCDWMGIESERLRCPNPFSSTTVDIIFGCPECYEVNTFEVLCDVEGCNLNPSIGKPTKEGYKRLCWRHNTQELNKQE